MKGSQQRIIRVLLILSVSFSALALTLSADDQAAREAAMQWLQVVDTGKYTDAAQMMSQEIRDQKGWRDYFVKRRAALGRASRRHVFEVKHTSTIPGAVGVGKYAVLQFKTSFERGAAAIEQVVMARMGCCWEVFGYSIAEVASDR